MTLSSITKTLWEVWGEPAAEALGLHQVQDWSYGRWKIPFSAMEKRLYEKTDVEVTFHKVLLENGKDWVWYQVWQDPVAIAATGRNADMIFVHGTGVHSGTLASQCRRYLDAGFRLLVPDLPSHGYSSGLHVYQKSLRGYTAGLHAVLHDVARRDQLESPFPNIRLTKLERKKTFMLGLSFGGLVAFNYAIHYPASYRYSDEDQDEIPIDGIIGVGPMVEHDKKSVRIHPVLLAIFYFMLYVLCLGRLEVIVPHKKVVDKDPKVYESLIMQDPRSHQGSFRVGHLHSINQGMKELQRRASEIRHPIYTQMGGQDKVANSDVALDWIRNVDSDDKRFEVYPVCQHVIYKKAKTEHDDLAGRITVIADNVEWMCERAPARPSLLAIRRTNREMSYSSDISSASTILSRSTSRTSLFDRESFEADDSDSVCTSLPATPLLQEGDLSFQSPLGKLPDLNGISDPSLLPSHQLGWKTDEKGEERLYRLTWEFSPETRPFLYNPHRA